MLNQMEKLSTLQYRNRHSNGVYVNNAPIISQPCHGIYSDLGPIQKQLFEEHLQKPMPSVNALNHHFEPSIPSTLTIHPTPQKSRVETQIPIRLTLFPMPKGAKRLHLPTYSISKPKLLAKPTPPKAVDLLELSTMLVCTSAMQEPVKRQKALARAVQMNPRSKKEETRRSSSGDMPSVEDDENSPLNGGEVNICMGCITRERKRAARKKSKRPEEEEPWQRDEAKRIIVFNTSEVKDWQIPTSSSARSSVADGAAPEAHMPLFPEGAMQIDAPMRIACYCRHQNEKMGFQYVTQRVTLLVFEETNVA